MQKYVEQLLIDIDTIILERWRRCPPHFWQFGIPDPWLVPPEGLNEVEKEDILKEAETKERVLNRDLEAVHREGERYLEEIPRSTMFFHFGLRPEVFPPAERLSDEQMDLLVPAIRRLWATFNFSASLPDRAPSRVVYPLLVERMNRPAMLMEFGVTGIEFCDYEPERCPFGKGFCECTEKIY